MYLSKSKSKHLNHLIYRNFDVFDSSGLSRRCAHDDSMKIFDIFHLDIV